MLSHFFFQAEDGIRDLVRSRGLGDVYKRQVLIVDDNDFNRDGLVLYLQNSGYATLEAADAAAAYALAETHHPDSAVVDIVIPAVPGGPAQIAYSVGVEPVSYTHLTLPTSDLG